MSGRGDPVIIPSMFKIIITLLLLVVLSGCTVERPKPVLDLNRINWGLEAQLAAQAAATEYQKAKEQGLDFTNGPCLANFLFGNPEYPATIWVLDIAHNPSSEADDLPVNQCSAFIEGQALNYIELDENGNILKIYSPFLKEE